MPKMDGISFLKKLMVQYPLPIIVISSSTKKVFEALEAGAVDFVNKPDINTMKDLEKFIEEIVSKLKVASVAKMQLKAKKENNIINSFQGEKTTSIKTIAIGASTGGTDAILTVLQSLPETVPGIVIVQHMPPVFTRMYAERLNTCCKLNVKEAESGDEIKQGSVLIAPGDYHMKVYKEKNSYYVKCYKGEKVSGHCPSVDILFESISNVFGEKAIGVILTGMGKDGAKGLLDMRKKGAYTIGQDEKTSIVYGMPMVSYNIGAVKKQVPLEKISGEICKYLNIK
jgi:two-component system chemotaxis response regulator CheB